MPSPSSWATLPGQRIQKWILYQEVINYTNLVTSWDPIQFEDCKHLPEYEETDGSISYLRGNIVKLIDSLLNYMTMLIKQDRPADQKYNALYFVLDEQWSKLTAHDMQAAQVNEVLVNHRPQTTPGAPMSHFTSPSS